MEGAEGNINMGWQDGNTGKTAKKCEGELDCDHLKKYNLRAKDKSISRLDFNNGLYQFEAKGMPKCKAHYSPVHRSYSMNKRIPIDKEECSFHLVSLTSSTLGSLRLDPLNQIIKDDQLLLKRGDNDEGKYTKAEFEMGLIEANTWSQ
ncbi:hypothetical protein RND71_019701 [Anisodus tanguticus]|uniref:Uncharacterized protein n=1 Tax=Anisodus tanguticus TaxID=243964 RepID=A0AAE1RXU9_9SOLA|nr:hypothetical protein RND71_019701 [Anisodus tanguticus]